MDIRKKGDHRRYKVYVLYYDGAPVYVGRTLNLDERLYQHKFRGKLFDSYSIAFDFYSFDKAETAEYVLLSYFKSIYPNFTNKNSVISCGEIIKIGKEDKCKNNHSH